MKNAQKRMTVNQNKPKILTQKADVRVTAMKVRRQSRWGIPEMFFKEVSNPTESACIWSKTGFFSGFVSELNTLKL